RPPSTAERFLASADERSGSGGLGGPRLGHGRPRRPDEAEHGRDESGNRVRSRDLDLVATGMGLVGELVGDEDVVGGDGLHGIFVLVHDGAGARWRVSTTVAGARLPPTSTAV